MKELLREFFASILGEAERKYKARNKDTGRVVPFGSEEAMKNAIKAGTHEPVEKQKASSAKPKPAAKKVAAKKTAPVKTGTPKKPDVQTEPSSQSQKQAANIRTKLYGSDKRPRLLQSSKSAQSILDKGFHPGKGAPPGNPGSNFNENMSNEGVLVLERYPDADEETLARVLFEVTRRSRLGQQQKQTAVAGSAGIKVPTDIKQLSEQEQIIYKNCVVAARSARQKFERARAGATAAQSKGFGKKIKHRTFGGAKGDLEEAKRIVSKAKKVFVYDEELGVIEIPTDVLMEWISQSGGGENAADTIVLTVDEHGNVLYDGWSDKKTLKDIQGNSTLNEEYSAMVDRVAELQTDGAIDDDSAQEVYGVLQGAQITSEQIERGYSDVSKRLSEYFLRSSRELQRYGKLARDQKGTSKHYANFARKIQAVQRGEAKSSSANTSIKNALDEAKKKGLKGEALVFYILCRVAQDGELTADDRKIMERTAAAERQSIAERNGGTLPKEHRGLDVEESLSQLRLQVIDLQRETVKKLNKIKVKTRSGKRVQLGNLLKAREIIAFLHLDKIDRPKNNNDHRQILRRSTQLVMEGIPISPKKLRSCLGVRDTKEFEDNFEIVMSDDDENTVYVYAINKEGKRILIAKKVYRSKTGLTGATGTTVEWTKEMQKCFDSK